MQYDVGMLCWANLNTKNVVIISNYNFSKMNEFQTWFSIWVLPWFYNGSTVVQLMVLQWFYGGSTVVQFSGSTMVLPWFYMIMNFIYHSFSRFRSALWWWNFVRPSICMKFVILSDFVRSNIVRFRISKFYPVQNPEQLW